MLDTHFSPWPSYTDEEVAAVQRVLLSNRVNYWTGTECREFEKEFATWVGSRYAVAMANGTLALEAALRGIGIGPGDEVVVSPRTFIASASCVVSVGSVPVFADVDIDSGNLTASTISRVLTSRTRAVICVHLAGCPCDMDPIMDLAKRHGLKVIEDCAQAHGARYKGRSVGSIGNVGAWSFCQDKIMTTGGEGGMVTTNDDVAWRTMWSWKDHGKSFDAVYERQHPPGFRWLHESFGSNWRMTEMQAAIGRIQLRRMAEWTAKRRANAAALTDALRPFSGPGGAIRIPFGMAADARVAGDTSVVSELEHAQYKFYIYVRPENLSPGWSRDRIIHAVNAAGVPCYQGSCSEIYLEKAFADTEWHPKARLPVARQLGETAIMLLVHPTLRPEDISLTCQILARVLTEAGIQDCRAGVPAR